MLLLISQCSCVYSILNFPSKLILISRLVHLCGLTVQINVWAKATRCLKLTSLHGFDINRYFEVSIPFYLSHPQSTIKFNYFKIQLLRNEPTVIKVAVRGLL